ncbi:MAG: MBL fold metallo-hydrolase [Planctomycetes bacterium]|nr:MBL fold metallo-hydrolase [Planctomycetota bacterium]
MARPRKPKSSEPAGATPLPDRLIIRSRAVGPFVMNCWIVASAATRECAVIDPGDEIDEILGIIEREKFTPRVIINTHAHIDHIGGVAEFKLRTGLPFCLHRADQFWIDLLQDQARMFDLEIPDKPEVDRYLDEGDTVTVSDLTFRLFHCPGHTPGSLCYLIDHHLFVGDVLFAGSIGRTDLPGGNYASLISSIRTKLFPLGDHVIVHSGHGPDTTIGIERESNPFVGDGR